MKKSVITFFILFFSMIARAQNFKEWFQQNATQKDYLTEQIAQLKIYLELTEKGYKIAKEGLTTISEIKKGEFKLHKNRFDSLLIVNPAIGSFVRLQQITDLHGRVNQTCETLPRQLPKSFNAGQMEYIDKVLKRVYDDCQTLLSNLFLVIRPGNLAMTDDERIERIELCLRQMQDNYSFVKNFDQQVRFLAGQIQNEQSELSTGKKIHDIN